MKIINISFFESCSRSNPNFAEDFYNLYKEAAKSIPCNALVKAFLNNQKDLEVKKIAA